MSIIVIGSLKDNIKEELKYKIYIIGINLFHNFRASSHDEILQYADFYSLLDNEFFFDRHPR